jgi:coenzyme F420-reducing hydrogenase beta subunit
MNQNLPRVYAVKHKQKDVIAASRSGGVFTALSDFVLENKGVIYGCVLNTTFNAVHTRAESAKDRDLMRGSKYTQSQMKDVFKKVENDLLAGRKVLFSGTPCQVAGLKLFLRNTYDNLLCVDLVCHGVPSPKVWSAYLHWLEEKKHSKVSKVDFRNKRDFGWRSHIETISFENKEILNSTVFSSLFYTHNILRPSCYECPFKSTKRPGDISIADYWLIENAAPEFDDNLGTSLVLINNKRGMEIFGVIKSDLLYKETRLVDSMQRSFVASYPQPESREKFWNDYSHRQFNYIAKHYGGYGFTNKCKAKIRKLITKLSHRNNGK